MEITILKIGYIIVVGFIMTVLIVEYFSASKMDDHPMMERKMTLMCMVMVASVLGGVAVNVLIPMFQKEENEKIASDVKKYNNAISSGYTLYYEGQPATPGAIGIRKKNINDYDIDYDKKDKAIRVTKHKDDDTFFIPIFYHY